LSDDRDLPFGHNTLKLRALFIPDGADVAMADIIQVSGPHPVPMRAVWVPPGAAMPGYPYEHIGQAVFIPDSDDRDTPAFTRRQNPLRMSLSRATSLSALSRSGDPRAQEDDALGGRQWSGSSLASPAGPWAPATNPTGGNRSSGRRAPRRGVRSAQANFSAAVPTPSLDTSRDAIAAAVRALRATGSFGTVSDLHPAALGMSQSSLSPDQQQRDNGASVAGVAAGRQPSAGLDRQRQYSTDVTLLPEDPTYLGVDHECVALVRNLTHAPEAKTWDRGGLVRGNQAIQPGTAIATFDKDGRCRGHAAIYLGQNARGLIVFDQWAGKGGSEHPGQVRIIEFRGGRGLAADDWDQFHVVVTQ
jgi:hypothetical protein